MLKFSLNIQTLPPQIVNARSEPEASKFFKRIHCRQSFAAFQPRFDFDSLAHLLTLLF
jgi:hypothetical protein